MSGERANACPEQVVREDGEVPPELSASVGEPDDGEPRSWRTVKASGYWWGLVNVLQVVCTLSLSNSCSCWKGGGVALCCERLCSRWEVESGEAGTRESDAYSAQHPQTEQRTHAHTYTRIC